MTPDQRNFVRYNLAPPGAEDEDDDKGEGEGDDEGEDDDNEDKINADSSDKLGASEEKFSAYQKSHNN